MRRRTLLAALCALWALWAPWALFAPPSGAGRHDAAQARTHANARTPDDARTPDAADRAAGTFSEENAAAIVRHLAVGIGPRPMGSPAEREALRFAAETLLDAGCDTAYVMPMTRAAAMNTSSGVAVGIRRGATGRIIVLGGHIDSAGPEIPGAIDNASGSAVVLEAARVLCREDLESTIVFALFGGEEQGLRGSEHFVERFPGIDSVVLMIQVDMANGRETLLMDPDAHGVSAPAWLVRAAVEEHGRLGYRGLAYYTHYFAVNYALPGGSGSDHAPFLRAGIPAIDFTTDVGDPIHTMQDGWEQFDPGGLRRSGELALALVRRFDGGVPDRSTSTYWLYLFLGMPVIVPIPVVWAFVAGSLGGGLLLLLRLRRGHLAMAAAEGYVPRRWTTTKLWLVALFVAALGWLAPDLIGLLKGDRFPWFAHPRYHLVLGVLAAGFGLMAGVRIGSALGISLSPYALFKRSFIILGALTLLLAWAGVEMAVGPALCLALLSVALVIPHPFPAAAAALIAPVWMFRLIFSEADTLLFRFTAPQLPADFGMTAAVNGVWILLLSLFLLAWLPGAVAVIRRRENPGAFIEALKSRRFMVFTGGLFGIWALFLLVVPSYERPWLPRVLIEEIDDGGADTLRVRGSEFLRGASVSADGLDTVLTGRVTGLVAPLGRLPGERRLAVAREVAPAAGDTSTRYDVRLAIEAPRRPYTLSVRYASSSGRPVPLETPLATRTRDGATEVTWYSFPDLPVGAEVSFSVGAGDTVTEVVTATFDTLARPVEFRHRQSDVIRRSVVRERFLYPGPPAAR